MNIQDEPPPSKTARFPVNEMKIFSNSLMNDSNDDGWGKDV
jgi:hypothetical protein